MVILECLKKVNRHRCITESITSAPDNWLRDNRATTLKQHLIAFLLRSAHSFHLWKCSTTTKNFENSTKVTATIIAPGFNSDQYYINFQPNLMCAFKIQNSF